jgi:hypothetical protein
VTPTRRLVSLIVAHPDGSLSSVAFAADADLFDELTAQLVCSTGGPLYSRHIPASDVAAWAPQIGRLGVVVAAD